MTKSKAALDAPTNSYAFVPATFLFCSFNCAILCLRSSFLRAISAAFSSFVIPSLLGAACGDGDDVLGKTAPSLSAGDANGVARGLEDGVSAAMRDGRARGAECVRPGLSVSVADDDVSSVTGMGTGGGAGSSNAPHGSSSFAVPPQPALGEGALSNAFQSSASALTSIKSPSQRASSSSPPGRTPDDAAL